MRSDELLVEAEQSGSSTRGGGNPLARRVGWLFLVGGLALCAAGGCLFTHLDNV